MLNRNIKDMENKSFFHSTPQCFQLYEIFFLFKQKGPVLLP